jgi:GNAT superfamily N-acetyltransferase
MSDVTINRATPADAGDIAILIGEIEAYYGGDGAQGDVEAVYRALFGPQPAATVLLARDGDAILGLASYSLLWPAAGTDKSLFLKELYVREGARRRGVGAALMAHVHSAAAAAGCSRVEWHADEDNALALAFYAKLGVEPHDGKIFYRTAT